MKVNEYDRDKFSIAWMENALAEIFAKSFKDTMPIGKVPSAPGTEVYHIGEGCLTGKAGWEEFNKTIKTQNEKR